VIVQSGGRQTPPSTLLQAAQLAAFFSSARRDRSVAVDYTERKYVRRVKGAGPGLVTYSHETTLHVTPKGP
jgi:predicted ribosome quality control (RQC) complex YloA/Tae2 family protein